MSLEQVVAESDFLTIHLPKTAETAGLIGRDLLLKAKPGLRIVNVARGGIVDEAALAEAIRDGTVAGAALDVFATEPTTDSPLFGIDSVVVTPHLGASTREAQDKAGDTIADMVQLALAGEFVPFAVNLAVAEAHESLRPFLPLAERLGGLFGSLVGAGLGGAQEMRLPPTHRGVRRRRDRRPRHAHRRAGGAQGAVRPRVERSGHVRQRPAAGQGPRARAARDLVDDLGRLRQPGHRERRRPLDLRARCTGGAASSASCSSTGTRSTCRRSTTW